MMQVAKAILGGSTLAALAMMVLLAIFNVATAPMQSPDAPLAYLAWFGITFALALLVASSLGLIWHAFASARGWRSVWVYAIAGAAAGAALPTALVVGPALVAGASLNNSAIVWAMTAAYGALLGALTALFAWLLRRPDRDAPNPPTSAP